MTGRIKLHRLKGKQELPAFKSVISGCEDEVVFRLNDNETGKIAVLSVEDKTGLTPKQVKTGESRLTAIVCISPDSYTEDNKAVFIRNIVGRVKRIKGLTILENTVYILAATHITEIVKQNSIVDQTSKKVQNIDAEIESVASRNFKELIDRARKDKVSDVHMILRKEEEVTDVEFRINGEIEIAKHFNYTEGMEMVRSAYNTMAEPSSMSHPTFTENEMQDCRIIIRFPDERIGLRYASSQHENGLNIVMRMLYLDRNDDIPVSALGFLESQVRMIEAIGRKPVGALLIAGVTGSGKSTTLKTMLVDYIKRNPAKKVLTIEQPVEYVIPGAVQIPVPKPKDGAKLNPFAAVIKTGMRQDPDVIMIGEVRDEVTAELLASATESGHGVLSTTHASSAMEIPSRLTGQAMRLPTDTVASMNFISGLIYQKLTPILCENCKKPFDVDHYLHSEDPRDKMFANRLMRVTDIDSEDVTLFTRNHDGCECCRKGIKGVEVCAEVINPDLKMRELWGQRKDVEAYNHWRSTRDPSDPENAQGKTALDIAIYKMNQGRICPHSVESVFGNIDEQVILEDGIRSSSEVEIDA